MKLPIPFDWNGTDWCRFSICWPDSPQWLALLRGFVTYAGRGRAWDEKTGIIIDVQAIGKQIAEANLPLQGVAMTCQEANNVARSIILLACAMTGQIYDPESHYDLEEVLGQVWNFQSSGLANRIGPQTQATEPDTIQATLERLKTSVDNLQTTIENAPIGEDLEDDLARVWSALDDITIVLGGEPSEPPEPL